jgi:hypothetical protein
MEVIKGSLAANYSKSLLIVKVIRKFTDIILETEEFWKTRREQKKKPIC